MSASPCAHASRRNQFANENDGSCPDASSDTDPCRKDDDDNDDDDDDDDVVDVDILAVTFLVIGVTALFPLAPLASHMPVLGPFQSLVMIKSTAPLAPETTSEQTTNSRQQSMVRKYWGQRRGYLSFEMGQGSLHVPCTEASAAEAVAMSMKVSSFLQSWRV